MIRSNPPEVGYLNAGLVLSFDGLTIAHFPGLADAQVIVSLAIGCEPINCCPTLSIHLTPEAFQRRIANQFPSISLPIAYQTIVDDPALLHLVQLLQTEIQQPQALNQMFVWSIVPIIVIQVIRQHTTYNGTIHHPLLHRCNTVIPEPEEN